MPNTIHIPTPLRPFTNKNESVEVSGATVGELLADLTKKYDGLRKHLYADDGRLRNFVNVYLNDEDIRYLQRENTPVKPGDSLSIVPSVAGGSPTAPADLKVRAASDIPAASANDLNADEIKRYSRHLIMPEVGVDGQKKLKAGSVLCIGAGGLGSPAAMYLAAAGVGRIGIVDFDVVDFSNLQRQLLHGTSDVGRSKLESARDRLHDLNPHIEIDTYETTVSSDNALDLFKPYDVILDGTDNFPTRYLLNDASLLKRIPVVHGSIFRFEGQVTVFDPYNGPCYRCLLPEPPPPELAPSCAEAGVLGVLPGIIGSIQALETIKLLLDIGEPLRGRLLAYDALEETFRNYNVRRDPNCPACGEGARIVLAEYDEHCLPHAVLADGTETQH